MYRFAVPLKIYLLVRAASPFALMCDALFVTSKGTKASSEHLTLCVTAFLQQFGMKNPGINMFRHLIETMAENELQVCSIFTNLFAQMMLN